MGCILALRQYRCTATLRPAALTARAATAPLTAGCAATHPGDESGAVWTALP